MKTTTHPQADDYLRRLEQTARVLPRRNAMTSSPTFTVICRRD